VGGSEDTARIRGVQCGADWFIEDFRRVRMGERGFEETVQTLKLTRFGGMAHCFVVSRDRPLPEGLRPPAPPPPPPPPQRE
jgi:hypothetical protein